MSAKVFTTHNKCLIGCHVPAAGGLWNAPITAKKWECETFQMFSRSPHGGPALKLTSDVVDHFTEELNKAGLSCFVIHAPYIINFGSSKPSTFHGSISIIRGELERGTVLGAKYVMFHPGSFKDLGQEEGIQQVKKGLVEVLEGYDGTTQLLIEISAGAGAVAGDTFEELAQLMEPLVKFRTFGGVCFDTQHAFASGYDIRNEKTATDVFNAFDSIIGLEYFKMSHVNDSKVEFGSHKDRHEHIGAGFIGTNGFTYFLAELRRRNLDIPLILETEHDKVAADIALLKELRNK